VLKVLFQLYPYLKTTFAPTTQLEEIFLDKIKKVGIISFYKIHISFNEIQ
jgi:hypothetical protein